MYITTLTSPFLLRQYLIADTTLKTLVGSKIFPINAPESTTGNFMTMTRTNYDKMDMKTGNYNETTTVELELCSKDYDTVVLKMVDAVRLVVKKMRDNGLDVFIDNLTEYEYNFVEGGESWYAEMVTIQLRNISTEIEID